MFNVLQGVPNDLLTLDHISFYTGNPGLTNCHRREARRKLAGTETAAGNVFKREDNSDWVKDFIIKIHPSMTCWKMDGKNTLDPNRMVSEKVRCRWNWQNNNGKWRKDFGHKPLCLA